MYKEYHTDKGVRKYKNIKNFERNCGLSALTKNVISFQSKDLH